LKLVKETSELRKIPVIMLSTPHRRQDITESYCQCANSYLTKPLGFRELG